MAGCALLVVLGSLLVVVLPVVLDGRERYGREGPRVTVTDHHPVQGGEGGEERVLHGAITNPNAAPCRMPAVLTLVGMPSPVPKRVSTYVMASSKVGVPPR